MLDPKNRTTRWSKETTFKVAMEAYKEQRSVTEFA